MATYDEESEIAERARRRIGTGTSVNGKMATVSRVGNDLRFNEYAAPRGYPGSYAIVEIGVHLDGGVVVRTVRPPGESYDERFAASARAIVERAVREDGHVVVPPGPRGRPTPPPATAAQLRREVADQMIRAGIRPARPRKRRTRA